MKLTKTAINGCSWLHTGDSTYNIWVAADAVRCGLYPRWRWVLQSATPPQYPGRVRLRVGFFNARNPG